MNLAYKLIIEAVSGLTGLILFFQHRLANHMTIIYYSLCSIRLSPFEARAWPGRDRVYCSLAVALYSLRDSFQQSANASLSQHGALL